MIFMSDKLIFWLVKELERRGWSQRELARRADLSPTSVSAVIAGQRDPTWDFCAAIAKPLEKSPLELFRLAGLLPPNLAQVNEEQTDYLIDDNLTLEELIEIAKRLPRAERLALLRYARFQEQDASQRDAEGSEGSPPASAGG